MSQIQQRKLIDYLNENHFITRAEALKKLNCEAQTLLLTLKEIKEQGIPLRWESGRQSNAGGGLIWYDDDPIKDEADFEERVLRLLSCKKRITIPQAMKILNCSAFDLQTVATKLQRELEPVHIRYISGTHTVWIEGTLPGTSVKQAGIEAICRRSFCEYIDKEAGYCPFRHCIYPGDNYIIIKK